ncbi:MAG: NAD-dependent epimerase/dehydratase family protein [Acidobacteriota bacterium]
MAVLTQYLILGAGYTGGRVAALLERQGRRVVRLREHASEGATRFDVLDPSTHGALAGAIEPGARVLYSLPVLRTPDGYRATAPLVAPLLAKAARVVYLSTTGVYGDVHLVDETTPAAPRHQREELRLAEEQKLAAGPWSTLVLRPAAIYGPGRGVHESMKAGKYRLPGDGSNFISRIHVDDLASQCMAALDSTLTGAFPVGDEEPCPARDIAAFCAELLSVPMPEFTEVLPGDDTRRANRRVDGRAIRAALGVTLRYPSYRQGIVASLS